MLKMYCSSCGLATEYLETKPKFCASCGNAFGVAVAGVNKPPNQTKTKIEDNVRVDDENNYIEDNLPSNFNVEELVNQIEIKESKKRGITVGEIINQPKSGFTPRVGKKAKKVNMKEFLKSFKEEAGGNSIKRNKE